jgi:exodeoxyribonuclease VII large subunit
VSTRRFPNCHLEVVPVSVQGNSAIQEIVYAIVTVNDMAQSDVIILARGGGSLEDLSAFNSEEVARAVFASRIPVITGIGHETDFTIADFVADVRAPTPSAAAEMALPEKKQLDKWVADMREDLSAVLLRQLAFYQQKLDDLHSRLKSPVQIMDRFRQTLASHWSRIRQALTRRIFHDREKLRWVSQALPGSAPDLLSLGKQVLELNRRLDLNMQHQMAGRRNQVRQTAAALSAMNPASVLNRGYSIARTVPDQKVILDAGMVEIQDSIEIILARGRVLTRVEKTIHGKDHV